MTLLSWHYPVSSSPVYSICRKSKVYIWDPYILRVQIIPNSEFLGLSLSTTSLVHPFYEYVTSWYQRRIRWCGQRCRWWSGFCRRARAITKLPATIPLASCKCFCILEVGLAVNSHQQLRTHKRKAEGGPLLTVGNRLVGRGPIVGWGRGVFNGDLVGDGDRWVQRWEQPRTKRMMSKTRQGPEHIQ